MKKLLCSGVIFVIMGFLLGVFIFNKRQLLFRPSKHVYYVLEEGVYDNKKLLQTSISNLKYKIIDYNKDKYYVYLGISKDLDVITRLSKVYDKKGVQTIIKEKEFISDEFLTNVSQFDLLIKDTKDDEQILTIEEVVLANYEEIFKKK